MRIALASCSNLPGWEVDDRPLHAAFAARGIEVVQPAWDDADFDWAACHACLIRTTWDYTDKRDEFVAWARRVAAATRLFNPPEIIRWNTHKTYLLDLEQRGVPVIPTVWLEAGSKADPAALLAEHGWKQAFLKPVIGSTARETLRFDASEAGIAAADRHLSRMLQSESMLLQPYLKSVESEGEYSVIFIDGRITHCVRKIPVAGDYRVQDDFGAKDEPVALTGAERRLASDIVAAVDGDLLYARVDFLRDDDGDLKLGELELVEPSLFFRHEPGAAERLADALLKRMR